MIRALRPTDVLAYLAFRNEAPGNEALTSADGQATGPSIGNFLGGSLALDPFRESWVLVERGRILGLVASRTRLGADLWEVEQLISSAPAAEDRIHVRLLEHLCSQAAEDGVQKVYLRLREESEALVGARQAGFYRYTTEQVYCHCSQSADTLPPVAPLAGLRPRRPVDHQALFQLYTSAVPACVRQVEGLTLQEWRWTDGWRVRAMPWRSAALHRRDFVLWRDGTIDAWLQVEPRSRVLGLLVSGREPELALALLAVGLRQLGPGRPVHLPLREYQAALRPYLEEQGFTLVARHVLLARSLAIRLPEGKLVPARAL